MNFSLPALLKRLFIVFCLALSMVSTSPPVFAQSFQDIIERADTNKWQLKKYNGLPVLHCRPGRCSSFQRIAILPPRKNIRLHRILLHVSVDKYEAAKLVKLLVREPVTVQRARVYRHGDAFYMDADFDTNYSGGVLLNVGRLVVERNRVYGFAGVSPSRAQSRKLMQQGFGLMD